MPIVTLPFTIANGQLLDANPVTANFNALANAINNLVVPLTGPATLINTFTFTSSPLVPTATPGDNTTKAASTAYVENAISAIGAGSASFRNKILNNAMQISQRLNIGTGTGNINGSVYVVDRWGITGTIASRISVGQNLGATGTPSGQYNFWLGATVSVAVAAPAATDTFFHFQRIERDLIRDLEFGTASAFQATLSFWAYSNVTGIHSGALVNGAYNRSYPFTFTISASNTWQFFTVVIPGDTTGTWLGLSAQNTLLGMELRFNLGSGANFLGAANAWAGANLAGATGAIQLVTGAGNNLGITGVRLEKGAAATTDDVFPLEVVQSMCQRYYEKSFLQSTNPFTGILVGAVQGTQVQAGAFLRPLATVRYNTIKRITPTITLFNPQIANAEIRNLNSGLDWTGSTTTNATEASFIIQGTTPVGSAAGDTSAVQWTADAEL